MLKEMNQKITQEATNLTNALKGQSKTQGNWGEFILESILEKSGLVKGREYVVQESLTAESGKRFQPDVIINLPENKSIIIDSKVSLIGYEKFISSDDEREKQLALREHINSIRSHIKSLSGKNYQNLYQLESLDFVLMFMPIEPAFAYAVQSDASLFTDAFERNIVIVSPSTLLATLRTIASIWRQENQNRNALEIAKQSGDMLDKFTAFVDDLISVGKGLMSAKDNYDKAMNKLVDGRGNLVNRAEKIKQLGAKASKTLPPSILNRADLDDDNMLENE
jgi:DNA recombination protein RmuC